MSKGYLFLALSFTKTFEITIFAKHLIHLKPLNKTRYELSRSL